VSGGGHPVAGSTPLRSVRVRMSVGRLVAQVNLVPCAPAPTSLFMALCDGDPPTMERLGAPDQGADPICQLAVGPIGGDHLT